MADEADLGQAAEALFLARARPAARAVQAGPGVQARDSTGRVLCLDCGEPVPPARLAALPQALRCRDCQTEWEER